MYVRMYVSPTGEALLYDKEPWIARVAVHILASKLGELVGASSSRDGMMIMVDDKEKGRIRRGGGGKQVPSTTSNDDGSRPEAAAGYRLRTYVDFVEGTRDLMMQYQPSVASSSSSVQGLEALSTRILNVLDTLTPR